VVPDSRGDPMSSLRWTLKSTRVFAAELTRLGRKVGANLVGDLLHYMGYRPRPGAIPPAWTMANVILGGQLLATRVDLPGAIPPNLIGHSRALDLG